MKRKKKEAEKDDVVYRGITCYHCMGSMVSNLSGTIVRHLNGIRYGFCVKAILERIKEI